MRRLVLWRGHHGAEVESLIREAWEGRSLLILLPPDVDEKSFLKFLPGGAKAPTYPDEPVLGLFSTGTLGRKLVLYSRRNIESSLSAILGLFDADRIETIYCYPQPFHTFGLILGYVHAIHYGRKLVFWEGPYGTASHEARMALASRNVLTLGTPTHFKDLMAHLRARGASLSPSYSAIIGAAKVEVSLWRAIQEQLAIESPSIGYGATEASPGVSHLPPGKMPREDGEVGYPLAHVDVRLMAGEGIEFSGPAVCLAIIRDEGIEFPKSVVISDNITRRDDGVLVFRGRGDLILNRGGEKFSLEQIETVIKRRLGVDAVCVPVPHGRLGEELGILMRTWDGAEKRQQVYELLKREFHRDFSSAYFREVPELPLNQSAKVDRSRTLKMILEDHA